MRSTKHLPVYSKVVCTHYRTRVSTPSQDKHCEDSHWQHVHKTDDNGDIL